MTIQQTFSRSLVAVRTWPVLTDLSVALCGLAVFFAVVRMGAYWLAKPTPAVVISHSIGALPLYAFYSVVRIGIAYLLSLAFAQAFQKGKRGKKTPNEIGIDGADENCQQEILFRVGNVFSAFNKVRQ